MRTLLVTGSDTGIGKTRVVAALARLCAGDRASRDAGANRSDPDPRTPNSVLQVQIVKVVETGRTSAPERAFRSKSGSAAGPSAAMGLRGAADGDAETARTLALAGAKAETPEESGIEAFTLRSFAAPLAPTDAARAEGKEVRLGELVASLAALPDCDWRVCEGAGGIASPLGANGEDWADFAEAAPIDAIILVVPDRLGAINQARLAFARAATTGIAAGILLCAPEPVDPSVAESNRRGIAQAGIPIWAELGFGRGEVADSTRLRQWLLQRTRGDRSEPGRRPESASVQAREGDVSAASGTGARLSRFAPIGAAAETRGRPLQGAAEGSREGERPGGRDRRGFWLTHCEAVLAERDRKGLRRRVRVTELKAGEIDLASNDYLSLADDSLVAEAVARAARDQGTSASASPLVTGWRRPHEELVEALCAWHRFPCGLLWSSGYAANSALLGNLPRRDDVVHADRLIHHSMIAGLLRSGARIRRYPHLDLDVLEGWLAESEGKGQPSFVVTESVFSMDGDYPDLARIAAMKARHEFCWVLDEAHGLGWYGPEGSGLARAAGVEQSVDVIVGTLGKALASGGAYTLFRDEAVRDCMVNVAGEFIYSTGLPPASAAGAMAALGRIRELAPADQGVWQTMSRHFRAHLKREGWDVPEGDSPIVPVQLGSEEAAVSLALALREAGILAASVRPPTVPAGTSRLRLSLKRTLVRDDIARVLDAMGKWRSAQ